MLFLIEYDRPTTTLVQFRKFADSGQEIARHARLELELDLHRRGVQHEVVILQAPNEEAIRHTHGRYFKDLAELARELEASLAEADGG